MADQLFLTFRTLHCTGHPHPAIVPGNLGGGEPPAKRVRSATCAAMSARTCKRTRGASTAVSTPLMFRSLPASNVRPRPNGPIHGKIALNCNIIVPICSIDEPFCRIIALIYSIVGPIYSIIAANQSMFAPNQSKMLRFGAFWNFGRPLLCQNGKLKEHDATNGNTDRVPLENHSRTRFLLRRAEQLDTSRSATMADLLSKRSGTVS